MLCKRCGVDLSFSTGKFCDNCGKNVRHNRIRSIWRNAISSDFLFNVIVSFIFYIAVNGMFHFFSFIYPLSPAYHTSNIPFPYPAHMIFADRATRLAYEGVRMSPQIYRRGDGMIASTLVLAFVNYFIGSKVLRQLNTKKQNFKSVSFCFIFGFIILNIGAFANFSNETFLFISQIFAGWLSSHYFVGGVFGTVAWNFLLAIVPFITLCYGLHCKWDKLHSDGEKETAVDREEVIAIMQEKAKQEKISVNDKIESAMLDRIIDGTEQPPAAVHSITNIADENPGIIDGWRLMTISQKILYFISLPMPLFIGEPIRNSIQSTRVIRFQAKAKNDVCEDIPTEELNIMEKQ